MLRTGVRRFLEGAVLVLLAALALVVVVGVGFRKAGAALVWYDEVASILLAWLTYYGAALAALRRAHIGVPTLAERLTGRWRARRRAHGRGRHHRLLRRRRVGGLAGRPRARGHDAREPPVGARGAGAVRHPPSAPSSSSSRSFWG